MDEASRDLSSPPAGLHRFLPAVLVAAAGVALVAGLLLPAIEFRRLFVLPERHSLLGVVSALLRDGEWFLGGVLGAFSVVFPTLKLAAMAVPAAAIAARRRAASAALRWMGHLGRWSMLDVLVVALVVFAVKRSGLAGAATLPGIWLFALSVVLSIAAAWLIERGMRR